MLCKEINYGRRNILNFFWIRPTVRLFVSLLRRLRQNYLIKNVRSRFRMGMIRTKGQDQVCFYTYKSSVFSVFIHLYIHTFINLYILINRLFLAHPISLFVEKKNLKISVVKD